VSASAVNESTFIWNPNLIALSSSVALAAAWHAWHAWRPRWWIVAGAASVVTMHCHVLGVILTPVVAALLVADVRRRRQSGDAAGVRAVAASGVAWVVIGLVSYVPLAIHELGSGGSEIRAVLAFLGDGGSAGMSLPTRIPIVALRVLAWPLAGLITVAPVATVVAAGLVAGLAAWRGWLSGLARSSANPTDPSTVGQDPHREEQTAVRWLTLGLVWTIAALAVGASSLATVVPGLPNDHYHAFADPMVFVLVGIGLAGLARLGEAGGPPDREPSLPIVRSSGRSRSLSRSRSAGALVAAAILVVLVGWNAAHQPPSVAADGGWPAARAAAARVLTSVRSGPIILASLPVFKTAEAVQFPLEQAGTLRVVDSQSQEAGRAARVVLCDQLFREAIGADCGGPAEDALTTPPGAGAALAVGALRLADRFEAAPGRWISVYVPD
jgi:hypothetical protein